MSEIVRLLEEKNEHLERFYNINCDELVRMHDGNYENLDNFYNSRDCILNMISDVDRRINDINQGLLSPDDISDKDKVKIFKALDRKNDVVQQILAQDLQILSAIEKEKTEIIKSLKETQVVKKVFNSYKSENRSEKGNFDESV